MALFTPSTIPDEEYDAPDFVVTDVIKSIHESPRFGHLNDIGFAASADNRIKEDYITGVVFMSAIVFITYITWLIILIVMRCLGQSRIGCASGEPPVFPSLDSVKNGYRPRKDNSGGDSFNDEDMSDDNGGVESAVQLEQALSNDSESLEDHVDVKNEAREAVVRDIWLAEIESIKRRIKRIRVAFVIAGLMLILTSGLLIAKGLFPLGSAYESTQKNVKQMNEALLYNMREVVNSTQAAIQARNVRDAIMTNVTSWCPNSNLSSVTIPSEALISQAEQLFVVDNGDGSTTLSFENLTAALQENLESLGTFTVQGQLGVHHALGLAKDKAKEIDSTMQKYNWWFFMALVVVVAVDLFSLIFVFGVIKAWRGTLTRCFVRIQRYFAMPIFTVLINILWLCVSGFMITAVLSADTCAGNPEENVVSIFNHQEASMDPLLFSMTRYYVAECTGSLTQNQDQQSSSFNSLFDSSAPGEVVGGKPTSFLNTYHSYLEDVDNFTEAFLSDVSSVDPTALVDACGGEVVSFLNTLTLLRVALDTAKTRSTLMLQGLYCSNFNPIYINMMHESVCDDGVEALAVIFSTLLVITICGMTMITLRVSWNEVGDEIDSMDDDSKSEYDEVEDNPITRSKVGRHDVRNGSEGQLTHVSVADDCSDHPDFSPRKH